ncbi:hypothetical protein [Tessaracoccus coleopterorum]
MAERHAALEWPLSPSDSCAASTPATWRCAVDSTREPTGAS